MTEKHYRLLELLREPGYHTGEELAGELQMSTKTVRLLIRELNEELEGQGALVESRHRMGYILAITDEEKLSELLRCAGKDRLPATSAERVNYLLRQLLGRKRYIKLDEVSEELYISKKTLSRELKEVERILKAYDLALGRRPGYGICVEGEEFNIRLCIAGCGLGKDEGDKQKDRITACVLKCLEKNKLSMSDVAIRNLILHIEVAIERIREDCFVDCGEEEWMQDGRREYAAAREIVEAIEGICDLTFPPSEVAYVAIHLAGKQALHGENGNLVISQEVSELVGRILELVRQGFSYDFTDDLELRMSLSLHIIPLGVRLLHNLNMKNPLLREIKEKYSLAYAMAAQGVIAVEQHFEKKLKDDEIGYFALLFALALERRKAEIEKKNILLVCASGHGSAELMKYRYRQEFGRYLNRVETCDINQLRSMGFEGFDYIFTTVPIDFPVPIPIQEVRFFLEEGDKRKVRHALEETAESGIISSYAEELFWPCLKADDRDEVLRLMCGRLCEKKGLPEAFYQSVLKREALAKTDFGGLVALPHSYEAMSDKTWASVAVLERPILWSDEEVQIVFLLSIEKEKDKKLQRFFQVTMQFLMDRSLIHGLIRRRDYRWFVGELARIETQISMEEERNG